METNMILQNERHHGLIYKTIGTVLFLYGFIEIITYFTSKQFIIDGNIFLASSKITIFLIFIYAGYLYSNKDNLAKKLLICTLPYLLFPVLFIISIIVLSFFKDIDMSWYTTKVPFDKLEVLSQFILAILIMIIIFKKDRDFIHPEEFEIYWFSKLLAYLAPGYGCVISGRYWIGFLFHLLFIVSQTDRSISFGPDLFDKSVVLPNLAVFVSQFIFWLFFATIDKDQIVIGYRDTIDNLASENDEFPDFSVSEN
jgi:hypothetical protein